MKPVQCGFSLIEAMVSMLVLSIGLLGLAQLQARLSMASLCLDASTQAYLLATSGIEQSLTSWVGDTDESGTLPATVITPTTIFETTNKLTLANGLFNTGVRVRWHDPLGRNEILLETAAHIGPAAVDLRLLLPAY